MSSGYVKLFVLLFGLDYLSKRYVEHHLEPEESGAVYADGRLRIRRMTNTGLGGGALAGAPETARLVMTAGAAVLGVRYLKIMTEKGRPLTRAAWTIMMSGGLGNLNDRWTKSGVTDFIQLPKAKWKPLRRYVFNIADILIAAGGAAVPVLTLFEGDMDKK